MEKKTEQLLCRMKRLVEGSEQCHQEVVERYLSLANRQLNTAVKKEKDVWGIIGASCGIKHLFKEKFGYFSARPAAIRSQGI